MQVKTIDINALEWFDKVNGNSYFAGYVTVNYGMDDAKTFNLPFQYGYGDHYKDMAFKLLQDENVIPKQVNSMSYWNYYRDNKIIIRSHKTENCLKRELMQIK